MKIWQGRNSFTKGRFLLRFTSAPPLPDPILIRGALRAQTNRGCRKEESGGSPRNLTMGCVLMVGLQPGKGPEPGGGFVTAPLRMTPRNGIGSGGGGAEVKRSRKAPFV